MDIAVLNKKAFKLPRVEKEEFILLRNLGCEYNREQAVFAIKSYNNIERLMDTISGILNTEVFFFKIALAAVKTLGVGTANTMKCVLRRICRLAVFVLGV